MTNDNLKRAIRAYMAAHGVNYTTARRAVLTGNATAGIRLGTHLYTGEDVTLTDIPGRPAHVGVFGNPNYQYDAVAITLATRFETRADTGHVSIFTNREEIDWPHFNMWASYQGIHEFTTCLDIYKGEDDEPRTANPLVIDLPTRYGPEVTTEQITQADAMLTQTLLASAHNATQRIFLTGLVTVFGPQYRLPDNALAALGHTIAVGDMALRARVDLIGRNDQRDHELLNSFEAVTTAYTRPKGCGIYRAPDGTLTPVRFDTTP